MSEHWDVIVVGAGAAGIMAGIASGRRGVRTFVLDSQEKIGAKILVAGGGRCNVTNEIIHPSRFNSGSERFVDRVLHAFNAKETHKFFNEIGVPLKLEPEMGKFFPVADSGKVVLAALLETLESAGATLKTGQLVKNVSQDGEQWKVETPEQTYTCNSVVVSTGGLALPKSGSNGAGYPWAAKAGHKMVFTSPALTPLLSDDQQHHNLSGLTLPLRLDLLSAAHDEQDARMLKSFTGSFLFTHIGYSGPAALNMSRHFDRIRRDNAEINIYASFLPEVERDRETEFLKKFQQDLGRRSMANALGRLLPNRLVNLICSRSEINANQAFGTVRKQLWYNLNREIFRHHLNVTGVASYTKAEATAGGVALDDIEPATMESRLAPGLFFAGEICDVDGWLGGYNFQWAWSSGMVAGRGASRRALNAIKQSAIDTTKAVE